MDNVIAKSIYFWYNLYAIPIIIVIRAARIPPITIVVAPSCDIPDGLKEFGNGMPIERIVFCISVTNQSGAIPKNAALIANLSAVLFALSIPLDIKSKFGKLGKKFI